MALVALPYPIQLINGNVADGGQVQADFNYVASQINANGAKNGVNSDITALTALISINSGVTVTGMNISGSTLTNCNLVGCTIDATTTGVTQPAGTNNTTLATTAFVVGQAFSSALPAISPAVTDFFVTNNGSVASWGNLLKTGTIRFADSADPTKRIAFDASQISPNTTITIRVPAGSGSPITLSGTPDFLILAQGVI